MLILGRRYRPEELLAQRAPMLLLDEIVDYGQEWLRSRITIDARNPFFEAPFGVPSYLGLELMAQTASAHSAIELVQRGAPVPIALLIGCREYSCSHNHFQPGTVIEVEARIELRDEQDFAAYACRVAIGAQEIVRSTLKAVRPKDLSVVLQG